MSQWKLFANASTNTSGPVQWVAYGYEQGSGNANEQANNLLMVSNSTPGNLLDTPPPGPGVQGTGQTYKQPMAMGQFAFTAPAYANAYSQNTGAKLGGYVQDALKVPGGTGWVIRKAFEGGISTISQAANGSGFANGETVTVSGGSTNATLSLTANATGNIAGATVNVNGLFPNTSGLTFNFNREQHVIKLNIGANTAAFTNLVAANTPVTVIVSANSTDGIPNGLNAVGTFLANSAAGINNTQLQTITWAGANTPPFANGTGFWGLFGNAVTNTAGVVITFQFANGQGVANGGGALSANLSTSTGGNVAVTLGGRAGRVQYETLVSTKYIANGALANSTHSSTYFPQ